jgi:DNA ligase 1
MLREFLQLAKNYKDFPHLHIGGWLMSEKLDGQRAWWDGGVSRGKPASQVPWANIEKDARLLAPPIATGLWSRYGKVIHAPAWWLDKLPPASLDGELWCGRGKYQSLRNIIGHHSGDEGWENVRFVVFDNPAPELVLQEGRINNPNFHKDIHPEMAKALLGVGIVACGPNSTLASRAAAMIQRFKSIQTLNFEVHEQEQLPLAGDKAIDRMYRRLDEILDAGGEGLIIRDPLSLWTPKRISGCLKVKPTHDSEGVVMGYIWGRETDKGSKLLGMMGAMVVKWGEITFELSGFTDEERGMTMTSHDTLAESEPIMLAGHQCSGRWTNPKFPIGSKVTFMYRELSDDGIPKEARYLRKRDVE